MKKLVLTVILLVAILICFACGNEESEEDIYFEHFGLSLEDFRVELEDNTKIVLGDLEVLVDNSEEKLYSFSIDKSVNILIYSLPEVNAIDVKIDNETATDNSYILWAKAYGGVITMLEPMIDVDKLIEALNITGAGNGEVMRFDTDNYIYEYLYTEQSALLSVLTK